MTQSFRTTLDKMVAERVAAGEDPVDLFEELAREANIVFGHYSLEYELGLMLEGQGMSGRSSRPIEAGPTRLAA
jgi:hypothetical protein